jgi:predicted DNA-binding protein
MVVEETNKTPTKTNRITIILSEEEKDLLRLLKKKTGKTASTIIRDGITLFWKRHLKEQELLKQLDD